MNGKWKTFAEFADSLFSHLVKLAIRWKATRLDFVADRYPENSIKNAERRRKASEDFQKVYILSKDHLRDLQKASPNSGRNISAVARIKSG